MTWRLCLQSFVPWCPGWGQSQNSGAPGHICEPWPLAHRCVQEPQSSGAPGHICEPWPLAGLFTVPVRSPLPLLHLSTRSLWNVFSLPVCSLRGAVYHVPALCRLCAHLEHFTVPVHDKSSTVRPKQWSESCQSVGGRAQWILSEFTCLCSLCPFSVFTWHILCVT